MSRVRQAFYKAAAKSVDYWSHVTMRFFVRDLGQRMSDLGISRSDLARKIDSSTAYVTKIMRGDVNFTLETMTKLAMAVDGKLTVRIEPIGAVTIAHPHKTSEWKVARALRENVASVTETLSLSPDQIVANETYNSEMQISLLRRAA